MPMHKFKAQLEIIGINPFVFVPDKILKAIFRQAGFDKGPIPIWGTVNENNYRQTLVKYQGYWRLYINTTMLKNSPKRIGEKVEVAIEFDPSDRAVETHPALIKALQENPEAKEVFEALSSSRRKEIIGYISRLKTEASIEKNVNRAIQFLMKKGGFVGRS